MAYVYDLVPSTAPPTFGYHLAAQLLYGDNGPANGPDPELFIGDASGDGTSGRVTWQPTQLPDGSWDTGWIPVVISIPPDGTAAGDQLSADPGNSPTSVAFSDGGHGSVTSVDVIADVQTNASVQWSAVQINFVKNGVTVDSCRVAVGPSSDTTDETDPSAVASATGISVTTTADADSVYVSGLVRMTLPPGSYPGPADLVAEVLISTSEGT